MAKKWPFKDPDEDLDYTCDWSDRVGVSDPIIFSTWAIVTSQTPTSSPDFVLSMHDDDIVDGAISEAGVSFGIGTLGQVVTDGATVVWLTGGQLGVKYELLNRIETQGGRRMDQTIFITVKKK